MDVEINMTAVDESQRQELFLGSHQYYGDDSERIQSTDIKFYLDDYENDSDERMKTPVAWLHGYLVDFEHMLDDHFISCDDIHENLGRIAKVFAEEGLDNGTLFYIQHYEQNADLLQKAAASDDYQGLTKQDVRNVIFRKLPEICLTLKGSFIDCAAFLQRQLISNDEIEEWESMDFEEIDTTGVLLREYPSFDEYVAYESGEETERDTEEESGEFSDDEFFSYVDEDNIARGIPMDVMTSIYAKAMETTIAACNDVLHELVQKKAISEGEMSQLVGMICSKALIKGIDGIIGNEETPLQ